ncbi:MAG: VOC family protein [Eubacteriales bacterium]|nr:VOC family protein [Eubacteriales bacterium]
MRFTDICFITNNVLRLRAFYEAVFGGKADGDEWHSSLVINGLHIVFLAEKNSAFYYEFTENANNTILSFDVEDSDTEFKRLLSLGVRMVCEPITHPWGARSFQFRDPDGNILNFRTCKKEQAE